MNISYKMHVGKDCVGDGGWDACWHCEYELVCKDCVGDGGWDACWHCEYELVCKDWREK